MKFSGAYVLSLLRRLGVGLLIALALFIAFLVLRALFRGPSAEAATNVYNPGFCLGGWENPEAAAGKPGKTEPNGGASAAYLAPDVFAQIFCGYFPVTSREKPPKAAIVTFAFSFSGEDSVSEEPVEASDDESGAADSPAEEESGGGGAEEDGNAGEGEEPSSEQVPSEEPEEPPAEEPSAEEASDEPAEASEPEAGPSAFLRFFANTAHAQAPESESLLVVSYSFDGVRWYAAGRVNRENAAHFTMRVPATMWHDLQNLQIMAAPLPISGTRPDIYLESVDLKVEADLTLGELAADSAAAVGDALGEVLGLADTLQEAAVTFVAPAPTPPAPPAKVKKLFYEIAGNPINANGAGRDIPKLSIEDDGTRLQVSAECDDDYFVILTYRSIEDFEKNPRSFVSNYADSCKGGSFTHRMDHLPTNTPDDVYYLVVGEQGAEGSWSAVSPLMPVKISQKEVAPKSE